MANAPMNPTAPSVGQPNTTLPGPNTTVTGVPFPTIAPGLEPPCLWILYADIAQSNVRIWDVMILVPNTLFLLFLLVKCKTACHKLRMTHTPIFAAFYGMVCLVAVVGVVRCVVFMSVSASVPAGEKADKILWLVLRFFLLTTEMSVVVFGLMFGHLDSTTSIRRVIFVTSGVALVYSVTQGLLEFLTPDQHFQGTNMNESYNLFGHGGMLFWLVSSLLFCLVYFAILLLPRTPLKGRFPLPTKRSFYVYVSCLAVLNLLQAVGSLLLYLGVMPGMCVVDVTSYLYFTCFAPLVYAVFLHGYFRATSTSRLFFSYKNQVEESVEEDNVTLPDDFGTTYNPSDTSSVYDSTRFGTSPNPLYAGNRQQYLVINSEDGTAGY